MCQEIMHIAVNSVNSLDVKKSCVNDCIKWMELETELFKKKDLIEKDVYDKLLKCYSTLKKRPKATRSVGSSSKVKIVESRPSNSKEPKQSWGSTISDVPSYSLNDCRKKHSHKPKAEDFVQEKLYLLHMDLYGSMTIQSINERKYILVIVDEYSRFTWVKFLQSKDEVPEFVIKFLKMIQVHLNATVCNIRTDNGIEFVNQTLKAYYE
ncbi:retrovirus-related pol polyprotein from transposon TNT 1-94 [Tanacetum coccineum]